MGSGVILTTAIVAERMEAGRQNLEVELDGFVQNTLDIYPKRKGFCSTARRSAGEDQDRGTARACRRQG